MIEVLLDDGFAGWSGTDAKAYYTHCSTLSHFIPVSMGTISRSDAADLQIDINFSGFIQDPAAAI